MANRAHLYAVDLIPSIGVPNANLNAVGLSEYNSDVPVAYKFLVSKQIQICDSAIWRQKDLALIGDYKEGTALLLALLKAYGDALPSADAAFDEAYHETESFLLDIKNSRKYILLEAGEIFELDDDKDLQANNKKLFKELAGLKDQGDSRFINGTLRSILDVKKQGQWNAEDFGITSWSNVLYYDLTKDNIS